MVDKDAADIFDQQGLAQGHRQIDRHDDTAVGDVLLLLQEALDVLQFGVLHYKLDWIFSLWFGSFGGIPPMHSTQAGRT